MRPIGLAVVLAVSLTLAPLATEAQQARQGTRVPRVGIILSNHPEVPTRVRDNWSIQAFVEGFRESGWVNGQNISIEGRGGAGKPERILSAVRSMWGSACHGIV